MGDSTDTDTHKYEPVAVTESILIPPDQSDLQHWPAFTVQCLDTRHEHSAIVINSVAS